MKGIKNIIGLSVATGMLIFAVPRLQVGEGWTAPTLFAICWLSVTLLIIAAHLHEIIGVDEEKKRELEQLKRYRKWKAETAVRAKMVRRKSNQN